MCNSMQDASLVVLLTAVSCQFKRAITLSCPLSFQTIVQHPFGEVRAVRGALRYRKIQDDRVHLCTFFSHRLTPAGCNYDVGNRELLAIRLALGDWHHWLEGAVVPFIVWTDHQNLTYICSAK